MDTEMSSPSFFTLKSIATSASYDVLAGVSPVFYVHIQGVLLPDRQTLRGDSRHEHKHYKIGNHEAQTSTNFEG